MKVPTYKEAVARIALDDDPNEIDPQHVARSIAVGIVADLFGVTTQRLATSVVAYRIVAKIGAPLTR